MSRRFLKSVSISGLNGEALQLSSGEHSVEGLEIWTSKSKIVNDHLKKMNSDIEFVAVVNAALVPIWAIVDKPYNIYSSNEKSLEVFQNLTNYSPFNGSIAQNAILAKMSKESFLMFYIEKSQDGRCAVNCLTLDMGFSKLNEILSKQSDNGIDSDSYFIDEVQEKNDGLIDTLLKQKSTHFSNLNSKRQAELTIKQQQLQRSQIRHQFKKMITISVKKRMANKPKPLQNEVAEICFKGMCHKFRDVLTSNENVLDDLQKWLELFLDVLGE